MSTDQRTLPGTFTLDSDFRSWGSGLSAQLAAIGLVKTSDTGQIDWTTVLKPTSSGQIRGFEIWRFNDALQATKPVFIRLDYGSGLGYHLVPFVGAIPAEVTWNPALDSNYGGASAVGADVMLSPTVVFYGKPLFASWCIYKNTEITGLTPITFTHLGATRTYMPLGSGSVTSNNNINVVSGYALAMLWE
jgi:hypothetical protein